MYTFAIVHGMIAATKALGTDHNQNVFVAPPGPGPALVFSGNPVWNIGSTQQISWITNLTSYRLELWQQGLDPGFGYSIDTIYGQNARGLSFGHNHVD